MLAVLIFDKKQLQLEYIESIARDMYQHSEEERNRISEWLLANQLMKSKKLTLLIDQWQNHELSVLRRLYWYHQARLRWTGKPPPPNTEYLIEILEKEMEHEEEDVQWAMNFVAGQIGIYDPQYRTRCITLGKRLALYKDDHVPKGCTPSYLPEFIRMESEKHGLL